MNALDVILLLIRWAHALAAVTWIGGSLFMLLVGRPALRSIRSDTAAGDAGGLAGRALAAEFRPVVATAIAVLIVTGVILSVSRLTSDAAGIAYVAALIAKIALALYAFGIAWLLPRRRRGNSAAAGEAAVPNLRQRIRLAVSGPAALTVAGVVVIGLADVLGWLFERGLAG